MRVLFVTLGTLGDLTPLVALAEGLQKRGHECSFVVPRILAKYLRGRAFKVTSFGSDSPEDIERLRSELALSVERARAPDERLKRAWLVELEAAVHAAIEDGQVLVRSNHVPGQAIERSVAETRVPQIVVCASDPEYLPVAPEAQSSAAAYDACLYPFSPAVLQREKFWPSNHHVTGFLFAEEKPFEAAGMLAEFLDDGPAPLVVSFGSMVHDDPKRVSRLIFEAASELGSRVVLQRGWSGLVDERPSSDCCCVGYVPHAWLFRRASCVVHHGGAGTTAAALRAGVPSVLVPHAFDQFAISRRMLGHGLARSVIPFQNLSVDALVGALILTCGDVDLQRALTLVAAQLERESGVDTACGVIEQVIERRKVGSVGQLPSGHQHTVR